MIMLMDVHCVLLQAEQFGSSFALETYVSENVKKDIAQAVSDSFDVIVNIFYSLVVVCLGA